MVFSSPVFVFIFLPIVFALSCAVLLLKGKGGAAKRAAEAPEDTEAGRKPGAFLRFFAKYGVTLSNYLLLAASLFFYAWGEPLLVFLMVGEPLLCYIFALLIAFFQKKEKQALSRLFLILALVSALGLLGFFKYFSFGMRTLGALPGFSSLIGDRVFNIALPLGISFYTFQILSYVIDVYRGKAAASKNFARVLLYVSLFPQLVAGPIVKYTDIEAQLTDRKLEADLVARGVRRFVCGLAKKMLIANTVAVMADGIFALGGDSLTGASAWCGAIAYLFQIYFDFSGYSDMAIGLGAMFGFRFHENFRYPYTAVSVQDFWRRWHISVSSWFKEYLYIPLGGNRKGRFRTCVNKIIVFFFTGLWHGANFTFIVWGLWHGFFLLLEEYVPGFKKIGGKAPEGARQVRPVLSALGIFAKYIYTMLVVLIGFVIFRADSLSYAIMYLGKMFTAFGPLPQAFAAAMTYMDGYAAFIFVLAAILSFPVSKWFFRAAEKLDEKRGGGRFAAAAETVSFAASIVLFGLCILSLASSSYNPFIYFRF